MTMKEEFFCALCLDVTSGMYDLFCKHSLQNDNIFDYTLTINNDDIMINDSLRLIRKLR